MATTKQHPANHSPRIESLYKEAKFLSSKNDMLATSYPVYKLMMEKDQSPKTIAEKTGISLPHVYNYKKLNEVPESVKTLIKAGKIRATDVLSCIKKRQTEADLLKAVKKFIAEKEIESEKQKNSLQKHGVVFKEKKSVWDQFRKNFHDLTGKSLTKKEFALMIQ